MIVWRWIKTGVKWYLVTFVIGDDWRVAARVGDLARPGEVLVSGTVKDLVLGSGIDLADRGTHALKGVPGEWHLFAVALDS